MQRHVRRCWRRARKIEREHTTKHVGWSIPIESIDIDLRRAGLDFDPGYLPWLRRDVKLVFA